MEQTKQTISFLRKLRLVFLLGYRGAKGNFRNFGLMIFCVAIGVFAVGIVNFMSFNLIRAIESQTREIVGGDILMRRAGVHLEQEKVASLEKLGQLSHIVTTRGMLRTEDEELSFLCYAKFVDGSYPLVGEVVLSDGTSYQEIYEKSLDNISNGLPAIVVMDDILQSRLRVSPGDIIRFADADFEVGPTIEREPDRLSSSFQLAPHAIIPLPAFAGTGLGELGTLLQFRYRLTIDDVSDESVSSVTDEVRQILSEGVEDNQGSITSDVELRTKGESLRTFRNNVNRFTLFMNFIGIVVMLVGGLGIVNSVQVFVRKSASSVAIYNVLGASFSLILSFKIFELFLIVSVAIILGALGAYFASMISIEWLISFLKLNALYIPDNFSSALFEPIIFGYLNASLFILLPISNLLLVRTQDLLKNEVAIGVDGGKKFFYITAVIGVATILFISFISSNPAVSFLFLSVAALVFLVFDVISGLIISFATRFGKAGSFIFRLAMKSIYGKQNGSRTIFIAMGLTVTLLISVMQIERNITFRLEDEFREGVPNFFFLDVQTFQQQDFEVFLEAETQELLGMPLINGKVLSIKGVPVEKLTPPDDVAWVINESRRFTFSDLLPKNSDIVEGQWWDMDTEQHLVAVTEDVAEGFGIRIGDSITISVYGREITAKVAVIRTVIWQSFGINFVFTFSSSSFKGLPYNFVYTAKLGEDEGIKRENQILSKLAKIFPTVTAVSVKGILEEAKKVIVNIVSAIHYSGAFALFISLIVLVSAVSISQSRREFDNTLLRILGFTNVNVMKISIIEFIVMSCAIMLTSFILGSIIAYYMVESILGLSFYWFLLDTFLFSVVIMVIVVLVALLTVWLLYIFSPSRLLRDV